MSPGPFHAHPVDEHEGSTPGSNEPGDEEPPVEGNPVIVSTRDFVHTQMVRADEGVAGERHEYRYDALGRRTHKTVDVFGVAAKVRYLYFGDQVVEERNGGGDVLATYVHGARLDELLEMRRFTGTLAQRSFYHQDDHGNVVALSDASGQVVERYEYTDYGLPLDPATGQPMGPSAVGNPYRFHGLRFDEETGLVHACSRYLDPTHGRFTSRDTIGHWGDLINVGNGLTWCNNNPWSRVDPYGTESWIESRWNSFSYSVSLPGKIGHPNQRELREDVP